MISCFGDLEGVNMYILKMSGIEMGGIVKRF